MQLFFNPELEPHFSEFKFDKTESRHIVRVLRKQEGDVLHITNGRGFLFEAEMSSQMTTNAWFALPNSLQEKKAGITACISL